MVVGGKRGKNLRAVSLFSYHGDFGICNPSCDLLCQGRARGFRVFHRKILIKTK